MVGPSGANVGEISVKFHLRPHENEVRSTPGRRRWSAVHGRAVHRSDTCERSCSCRGRCQRGGRARFEKQFQVETYAKPEDLFAENIDAIVVATPNRLHEQNVLAAFEQGLDVLVNKSLAHSLESAERIAEAASQTDAICMVGFHDQFRGLVRELRSLLADDHFGKITHVQANHVRRRGIPRKGYWMTSQEFAGGGALMDVGVHVIQILFTLFGTTDIREIMATTRRGWVIEMTIRISTCMEARKCSMSKIRFRRSCGLRVIGL